MLPEKKIQAFETHQRAVAIITYAPNILWEQKYGETIVLDTICELNKYFQDCFIKKHFRHM
jgi:hypothetical protein